MQTLDLEDLFQQLLLYRDRTTDISTLGPWLEQKITTHSFPCLHHLPFSTAAYTRTSIARESLGKTGFEALVIRWDQQAQTPIHGHPAFAFYHVISGIFEMELYSHQEHAPIHLKETTQLYPSDSTWHLGECGRYDNFIHRVTCLEAGFTFHVYSEDAQQGISL